MTSDERIVGWYTSLLARLSDILGFTGLDEELGLDDDVSVSYLWNRGHEMLKVERNGKEVIDFRGTFHPRVVCEGNPCRYCGFTERKG